MLPFTLAPTPYPNPHPPQGAPKAMLPFTLDEMLDARLQLHGGDSISVPPLTTPP